MRKIALIWGLVFVLFLAGCVSPQTGGAQETKLEAFEGLGVLGFDAQFKEVTSGSQFYVALVLRNNALGKEAKNIYVALENIEPFKIIDCKGNIRASDETRLNLIDNQCYLNGVVRTLDYCCLKQRGDEISHLYDPEFDFDWRLPHKQHGMSKMYSGGERIFYWLLEAPISPKIADTSYEHYFYYFIDYDYIATGVYPITILSQEEEARLKIEGKTAPILSSYISSGDLKMDFSKTQNPQLYLKYGVTNYNLLFFYSNVGKGTPYGTVELTVNLPKSATNSSLVEIPIEARRLGWDCTDFICKLSVDANQVLDSTVFELPFNLKADELERLRTNSLPYETYVFFFNTTYTYSLTGKTFIKVKSPFI